MLDLEEELDAVLLALAANGIEYALCGDLAMAVQGFMQATARIDLLIRADDDERMDAAFASLGFVPSERKSDIRRFSKADARDGETLILDLVLVTQRSERAWQSRKSHEWRGRTLAVTSFAADEVRHMTKVDYSDKAVELRIRQVSQLRKLCLSLAKANPKHQPPPRDTPPKN